MNKIKWMLSFAATLLLGACSSQPVASSISNPISKTVLERNYQDYSENNVYSTNAIPINGTPRVLVIPIWFTDSNLYINSTSSMNNVANDIETAFAGSESETGWHSVKTYYETLSNGKLSLQFTFSDWYECGYSTTAAGASANGLAVSSTIVTAATEWYFENNPRQNRGDYDYNKDGYIDAVMTIYAAPDYMTMESSTLTNLWAYCYWVQGFEPSVASPVPNCFFWASYDFMYDMMTGFRRAGRPYGGGDCSYASIDAHTYIHETGHCLGYDRDYYDYTGVCSPAGGFSMQDCNVGSHDPYSVMASGWADPYIPTESCTLTIRPFQESHDLILLTPQWNDSNSPFDEYLLLELYTPTGLNEFDTIHQYGSAYPRGPMSTGIRLWHIDARLTTCIYRSSGDYYFSTDLFNDPLEQENGSLIAMTNSYSGDYASVLGRSYYNFNQLQLIRNSTADTYMSGEEITSNDLFRSGSSFSMSRFSRQFVNGTKLNSGTELGWSFSVSISGSGSNATATIELQR